MNLNQKPVKTVFIDQGDTLGGAEHYLLDFLSALSATDSRQLGPLVVGASCPEYRAKLPAHVPRKLLELPHFKGGPLKKICAGFALLARSFQFARWLRSLPDLRTVYTNTPRAHFLMLLCRVLWRVPQRIRWIVTVHDLHTQKKFWKNIHQHLRRAIYGRAHTIIAVSLLTRQHILSLLPAAHSKIRLVENGLDFGAVPAPVFPKAVKNIVMLGRIDRRKGQHLLLEAAEKLPELAFHVYGAPFGQDEDSVRYQQELEQMVIEKHLNHVHLHGASATPWEAIMDADVVVMLPTEAETFGRVAVEALAMGKMVISANMPGPRDILTHYAHQAGLTPHTFILGEDVVGSLVERLTALKENPHVLEPLTQQGPAFARENYDLKNSVKQLFDICT